MSILCCRSCFSTRYLWRQSCVMSIRWGIVLRLKNFQCWCPSQNLSSLLKWPPRRWGSPFPRNFRHKNLWVVSYHVHSQRSRSLVLFHLDGSLLESYRMDTVPGLLRPLPLPLLRPEAAVPLAHGVVRDCHLTWRKDREALLWLCFLLSSSETWLTSRSFLYCCFWIVKSFYPIIFFETWFGVPKPMAGSLAAPSGLFQGPHLYARTCD